LEGEVDAGDRAVGPVDPELVAGEMLRALRCEIAPEGLQDSAVEAPARLEIRDAQMDVVDQAALMKLHGQTSQTNALVFVILATSRNRWTSVT
jgi:hypothetical protein